MALIPRLAVSAALLALAAAPVAAAGAAPSRDQRTVRGWARLAYQTPVRWGAIHLETVSGRRLAAGQAQTNARGAFSVVARSLPRTFVVVAAGGLAGSGRLDHPLRAVVRRGSRLPIAEMNLVTTLAAERQQRHPSRSYASAVTLVRRLLELPRWRSIDHDTSWSPQLFDGKRFVATARRHGGLSATMRRFGRRLDRRPPQSRPFHGRAPGSPASPRQAGVDFGVGGVLLEKLGPVVANQLFGFLLTKVGLGTGAQIAALSAEITEVQQTLDNVEKQLGILETAVGKLAAQLNKAELTNSQTTLAALLSTVDTAAQGLQYIADNPTDPGNGALTDDLVANTLAPLQNAAEDLNLVLAPSAGASSLLTVGQTTFTSQQTASDPLIGGSDLSDQGNALFEYYAAYQARLVNAVVEYANEKSLPPALTQSEYVQPALQTYLPAWEALVLDPLPPETFADLRTERMWALLTPPPSLICTGGGSEEYWWLASQLGMNAPDPGSAMPACGATPPNWTDLGGGWTPQGFTDWQVPALADLQAMVQGWNAGSPDPPSVYAWLTSEVGSSAIMALGQTTFPIGDGPSMVLNERNGSYGQPWGYWTSTCSTDPNTYFGGSAPLEPSQALYFTNLVSCSIFQQDGSVIGECVADENWEGNPGCNYPFQGDPPDGDAGYDGPINTYPCPQCRQNQLPDADTIFDYFHPNLLLAYRTPPSGPTDPVFWLTTS